MIAAAVKMTDAVTPHATITTAAVVVPLVVDPNDYKDRLVALVAEETGRDLSIKGEIGVSLFPWVGLEIGEMALGNAEGFGPQPMARVVSADVKVEFLPLLEKRLVVDRVVIKGLFLDLGRDAAGVTNWAGFTSGHGAGAQASASQEGAQATPRAPSSTPVSGGAVSPDAVQHDQGFDPGALALAGLTVGGVELSDAHIRWRDRVTGVEYAAKKLSLTTGALSPGDPVPLQLKLDIEGRNPATFSHLELSGQTRFDLHQKKIQVQDLKLSVRTNGQGLPFGQGHLDFSGQMDVDLVSRLFRFIGADLTLKAQGGELPADGLDLTLKADVVTDFSTEALSITEMTLKGPTGIELKGRLNGREIFSNPNLAAELKLTSFNPRTLLAYLGEEVPKSQDPRAFSAAQLTTDFQLNARSVDVAHLDLTLDGAHIQGAFKGSGWGVPGQRLTTQFDLNVDEIDVDRYLPPSRASVPPGPEATQRPAAAATSVEPSSKVEVVGRTGRHAARVHPSAHAEASVAAEKALFQLPVDLLRALDLRGKLRIGRLKAGEGYYSDVAMAMVAKQGLLRLKSFKANLYQGSIRSKGFLDVRGPSPRVAVDKVLEGVQIEPLLHDLAGEALLSGVASIAVKLNSRGNTAQSLKSNLNGKAHFTVVNGVVYRVDLTQQIRNTYLRLKGRPQEQGRRPPRTPFNRLSGNATILDGVIQNSDLRLFSRQLKLNGNGRVDLPRERVDYLLKVNMVDALTDLGKTWKDLQGASIPIQVKGRLKDPKYSVDLGKLLESLAKTEARRKLEEKLIKKLGEEKTQNKLRKLEEKLGGIKINIPGLQKALEGLF